MTLNLENFVNSHTPISTESENLVFKHYREKGFPYIDLTDEEKKEEFLALQNLDTSGFISEGIIKSDSTGVALANHYHRHRYGVVCNDARTAIDVFNRDETLMQVIRKCIKLNGGISDAKLRSMLSIFQGTQVASNFPTGTAKAIFDSYSTGEGRVYDPSCGFGGRLLAALSSIHVSSYTGTEPSTKTYIGLLNMVDDVKKFTESREWFPPCSPTQVNIYNRGSEDDVIPVEVDLIFTSPPYFNTEKYAREETQSFLRYPTQGDWLKYFLQKTFSNCRMMITPKGKMIINIANVRTFQDLEKECVRAAERENWRLIDTLKIPFGVIPGKGKRNKNADSEGTRNEPVFVFEPS
jgi:hypothetical protein